MQTPGGQNTAAPPLVHPLSLTPTPPTPSVGVFTHSYIQQSGTRLTSFFRPLLSLEMRDTLSVGQQGMILTNGRRQVTFYILNTKRG